MYKKKVGILIFILFIGTSFLPNIRSNNLIDELDQEQIEFSPYDEDIPWGFVVFNNLSNNESYTLAQSFKPNLPILTRVQLWFSQGFERMNCDLIISIRDTLNGSDLTMISISPDEIPMWPNYSWINCDFQDIYVNVGQTYYIVAKSDCGQVYPFQINYAWAYGEYTSYNLGMCYVRYWNYGWESRDTKDLCFKTFGSGDSNDMIRIQSLSGGFGFSAIIKNNRTSFVYDIDWSIDVEASFGIILSGEHKEDIIEKLAAGGSKTIQSDALRGIGFITINVQAGHAVKTATAFLLGPLVLRVNEI